MCGQCSILKDLVLDCDVNRIGETVLVRERERERETGRMKMRQPQADQRIVFAGVMLGCMIAAVPLMFKKFRENENRLANIRDGTIHQYILSDTLTHARTHQEREEVNLFCMKQHGWYSDPRGMDCGATDGYNGWMMTSAFVSVSVYVYVCMCVCVQIIDILCECRPV